MIEIIQSETFKRWLCGLRDRRAVARINARIRRFSQGHAGDVKPVREGISEMRIDYGPGYRVYFMRRGPMALVLLVGGDKHTQEADILRAIKIANDWRD